MSFIASLETIVDSRVKTFISRLLGSSSKMDSNSAFALWKEVCSGSVGVPIDTPAAESADGQCKYVFTRAPLTGQRCSVMSKSGTFCGKHKSVSKEASKEASKGVEKKNVQEAIKEDVKQSGKEIAKEAGKKKSILEGVNRALSKSPRKHSRDSDDEEEPKDKVKQAVPKRIDSDDDQTFKKKRVEPVVVDLDDILDELQEDDDNSL
jgi:hypothetical protein